MSSNKMRFAVRLGNYCPAGLCFSAVEARVRPDLGEREVILTYHREGSDFDSHAAFYSYAAALATRRALDKGINMYQKAAVATAKVQEGVVADIRSNGEAEEAHRAAGAGDNHHEMPEDQVVVERDGDRARYYPEGR